jgi:hypothetical protein
MGNFNRVKRVKTGGDDWIDVKPLSVDESREFDKKAGKAKDEEQAANMRLDLALSRIAAWSDEVPVSPKQAAQLPTETAWKLYAALMGFEDSDIPLPSTSPSIDTSEENAAA